MGSELLDTLGSIKESFEKTVIVPPPLPMENEQFISCIYGANPSLRIPDDFPEPLSPNSALRQAGKYLFRQEDKGFLKTNCKRDDPLSLYDRMLKSSKIQESVKQSMVTEIPKDDDDELADPQFNNLMNANSVKTSTAEILSLPYNVETEKYAAYERFHGKVKSYARGMISLGKFNSKKQKRKQLQDAFVTFVTEVYKMRDEIIKSLISRNMLDTGRLPEHLLEKFKDLLEEKNLPTEPPKPIQINRSDEVSVVTVLQHTNNMTQDLPSIYKPKPNILVEAARTRELKQTKRFISSCPQIITDVIERRRRNSPVISERKSPRVSQAIPKRPGSVAHKRTLVIDNRPSRLNLKPQEQIKKKVEAPQVSKELIREEFWKTDDPLSVREGKYVSPFTQFEQISNNIAVDVSSFQDDPPELFPLSTPVKKKNKIPRPETKKTAVVINTKDIGPFINTTPSTLSYPTLASSNTDSQGFEMTPLSYDIKYSDTKALEFLNQIERDVEDPDIYKKLESIWDKLGFSINRKLEMVLKYSKDLDESSKLSDALDMWERCLTVFTQYQTCYQTYKDYLKNDDTESSLSFLNTSLTDQIVSELEFAEEQVEQTAILLRTSCGDELIVKDKKISDLIAARRVKLDIIKKNRDALF